MGAFPYSVLQHDSLGVVDMVVTRDGRVPSDTKLCSDFMASNRFKPREFLQRRRRGRFNAFRSNQLPNCWFHLKREVWKVWSLDTNSLFSRGGSADYCFVSNFSDLGRLRNVYSIWGSLYVYDYASKRNSGKEPCWWFIRPHFRNQHALRSHYSDYLDNCRNIWIRVRAVTTQSIFCLWQLLRSVSCNFFYSFYCEVCFRKDEINYFVTF